MIIPSSPDMNRSIDNMMSLQSANCFVSNDAVIVNKDAVADDSSGLKLFPSYASVAK